MALWDPTQNGFIRSYTKFSWWRLIQQIKYKLINLFGSGTKKDGWVPSEKLRRRRKSADRQTWRSGVPPNGVHLSPKCCRIVIMTIKYQKIIKYHKDHQVPQKSLSTIKIIKYHKDHYVP
jgi:hypothetical protein